MLELSNGQKAELRDAETVTRKERNEILAAMPSAPQTIVNGKLEAGQIDFKTGMAGTDLVIAFMVTSWTFDLPLPSEKIEVLDELLAIDAGKLETAANTFIATLMPDVNADPTEQPSSP